MMPSWRTVSLCAAVVLAVPPAAQAPAHLAAAALRSAQRPDPTRPLAALAPLWVAPAPPPPVSPPGPGPALAKTRGILDEQAGTVLGEEVGPLAERIVDLADRYELEPELILAVVKTESGFHPGIRSSAGAVGLMQLLPGTAREVAGELDLPWSGEETLHDPEANLEMGIHYLARLRDEFGGDIHLALSAYNLGPARLHRYLERGRRPGGYARTVERHRRRYLDWKPAS